MTPNLKTEDKLRTTEEIISFIEQCLIKDKVKKI